MLSATRQFSAERSSHTSVYCATILENQRVTPSIAAKYCAKTFLGFGLLNQTVSFFKNTILPNKTFAGKYTLPLLGVAAGLHCFSLLFKRKAAYISNDARDIWQNKATDNAEYKNIDNPGLQKISIINDMLIISLTL